MQACCVASVSVQSRSKKNPRNGIFGFALLLAPFFARSLTLVPCSLLLNCTETLATQTKRAEADSNGWRLWFLKPCQPKSFSKFIFGVCDLFATFYIMLRIYLFDIKLWFCHSPVVFQVSQRIRKRNWRNKQNELPSL